jgi:hypothetical protein
MASQYPASNMTFELEIRGPRPGKIDTMVQASQTTTQTVMLDLNMSLHELEVASASTFTKETLLLLRLDGCTVWPNVEACNSVLAAVNNRWMARGVLHDTDQRTEDIFHTLHEVHEFGLTLLDLFTPQAAASLRDQNSTPLDILVHILLDIESGLLIPASRPHDQVPARAKAIILLDIEAGVVSRASAVKAPTPNTASVVTGHVKKPRFGGKSARRTMQKQLRDTVMHGNSLLRQSTDAHSPETATALEEATKDYKDKRSELGALMGLGILTGTDGEEFPAVKGTDDMDTGDETQAPAPRQHICASAGLNVLTRSAALAAGIVLKPVKPVHKKEGAHKSLDSRQSAVAMRNAFKGDNDKRSELVALMGSGKLTIEDAETFPAVMDADGMDVGDDFPVPAAHQEVHISAVPNSRSAAITSGVVPKPVKVARKNTAPARQKLRKQLWDALERRNSLLLGLTGMVSPQRDDALRAVTNAYNEKREMLAGLHNQGKLRNVDVVRFPPALPDTVIKRLDPVRHGRGPARDVLRVELRAALQRRDAILRKAYTTESVHALETVTKTYNEKREALANLYKKGELGKSDAPRFPEIL